MEARFQNLSKNARIRAIDLRNRIIMPSMETRFGTETGEVADRTIAHYAARARGDAPGKRGA